MTFNQKGFSFLEAMIASAVLFLVAIALMQINYQSHQTFDLKTSRGTLKVLSTNILSAVTDPQSFSETFNSADNDTFACLPKKNCKPGLQPPVKKLLKGDGKLYFNLDGNHGFTQKGDPCSSALSSECPIKYEIVWEPLCLTCPQPQVKLIGYPKVHPSLSDGSAAVSLNKYSFEVIRDLASATAVSCTPVNGRVKRIEYQFPSNPTQKRRCDLSDYVTTYVKPPGITQIDVEVIGGGGSGGTGGDSGSHGGWCGGGGGGGGGYARKNGIDVTNITSIPVVVGKGGWGRGNNHNNCDYNACVPDTIMRQKFSGRTTSFGKPGDPYYIYATGGTGGTGGNPHGNPIKAGGTGGMGFLGDINLPGAPGIAGNCTPGSYKAGAGGHNGKGYGGGPGSTSTITPVSRAGVGPIGAALCPFTGGHTGPYSQYGKDGGGGGGTYGNTHGTRGGNGVVIIYEYGCEPN